MSSFIYYPDHGSDPAQESRSQVEQYFEPHQPPLNREEIRGSKGAHLSCPHPPTQGHALHLPCCQDLFATAIPGPRWSLFFSEALFKCSPVMQESNISCCQVLPRATSGCLLSLDHPILMKGIGVSSCSGRPGDASGGGWERGSGGPAPPTPTYAPTGIGWGTVFS